MPSCFNLALENLFIATVPCFQRERRTRGRFNLALENLFIATPSFFNPYEYYLKRGLFYERLINTFYSIPYPVVTVKMFLGVLSLTVKKKDRGESLPLPPYLSSIKNFKSMQDHKHQKILLLLRFVIKST